MPWFCKSSRKRSKVKVGSETISKDDSVIRGRSKAVFGVILQDFPASTQDELTVQRGQVIELLYTDGSWQYVRNVDGKSGYVPNSFCHPLEQVKWMQEAVISKSSKIKPRPRTLHLDEMLTQSAAQTLTEGNASPQSTHPMQTEGSNQTRAPENNVPVEGAALAEAERKRQGDCSRYVRIPPGTNVSASQQQQPPSAEERVDTVPTSNPITNSPQNNSASGAEENVNVTLPTPTEEEIPQPLALSTPKPKALPEQDRPTNEKPLSVSKRTLTYHKAVGEEDLARPLEVQSNLEGHYDRLESYPSDTSLRDDVFLPDLKKPVGIFQCVEAYRARFQGEISLADKELVIVLEFGRGEWAWVITSTNMEGLVPKKTLVKYEPGLRAAAAADCVDHSTVATQTELVVTSALRQLSTSSAGAGNCSNNGSVSSKSPVRDGASPLTEHPIETSSIGVQTEHTSPDWFKHNSSPRHEESLLQPPKPELKTTRLNTSMPASPSPSSPMPISKARFCSEDTLEHGQLLQRHRRLAKSEPRCNVTGYSPLIRRLQPHTPILTAVRDYVPPLNAKNCLSLKKGDVLYQQSQVPYPNGWVWVYHSVHRSYGYVPKNLVAYMYTVPRKPRQCETGTLLEDEV